MFECVVSEFGTDLTIGDFDSPDYPVVGEQFSDLEGSEVRSIVEADGYLLVEIEWVS